MPIIGAHVSAAGGAFNAFINAQKIGAKAIQIFGASPRQWNAPLPEVEVVTKYKDLQKETGVGPVFLHGLYLANIGTNTNNKLWHGSVRALTSHMKIAKVFGAQGVVFHIGSVGKDGVKELGIKQVIKGVKKILANVPGETQLILENAAGGGGKLGAIPEEIGQIIKGVKSSRLKVCIDTQHAFAAGNLQYTPKGIRDFVTRCDKAFGWKNVVVVHLNDSETELGSFHDRHDNLGEGKIGLVGFKNLAKNTDFKNLPWILEVPGFDGTGPDKKNIDILKKIVKS